MKFQSKNKISVRKKNVKREFSVDPIGLQRLQFLLPWRGSLDPRAFVINSPTICGIEGVSEATRRQLWSVWLSPSSMSCGTRISRTTTLSEYLREPWPYAHPDRYSGSRAGVIPNPDGWLNPSRVPLRSRCLIMVTQRRRHGHHRLHYGHILEERKVLQERKQNDGATPIWSPLAIRYMIPVVDVRPHFELP